MIEFLLLGHVLHVLLQCSEAPGPALSLLLALAEEIQTLAGSFEHHRQTVALMHGVSHVSECL